MSLKTKIVRKIQKLIFIFVFIPFGFFDTVIDISIISSHITTKSLTMLLKYLLIYQNFICIHNILLEFHTYINPYSTFNLNNVFYHKICICNYTKYILLIFLSHLFLLSVYGQLNLHPLLDLHILVDVSSRVLKLPLYLFKSNKE